MPIPQFGNYGGALGGQSIDDYRRMLNDQRTQSGAFATQAAPMAGGAAGSGASPQSEADKVKDQIFGLAQGGIDRLNNDPADQMIRQYLQQQMGAQVLDPKNRPYANGAPQYTAQNATSQGYNASQAQAAQMGNAPLIGGGGPWDAVSRNAYMTDAADRAGAGESARNQMLRDAILANGGSANDPSLAASQAESLSQRNDATSRAANQLNMRATSDNFNAQRQADLANQSAQMGQMQFNAGNQQQANLYNTGARNQASQYGAEAGNRATLSNQSAQNQAGMFNTGNNMQAQMANFNAGNQALMYNQQQQSQAANQFGGYNNQRQNMLQNAEGNMINLLNAQRFPTGGAPQAGPIGMPSFQQYQQNLAPRPQQNMGYANPSTAGGLTGSVWAGSGRPSVGSGYTTSSFGPTQVGNPYGAGASVGTNQPAVSAPQQPQGGTYNPFPRPTNQTLAPQVQRQQDPANNYFWKR